MSKFLRCSVRNSPVFSGCWGRRCRSVWVGSSLSLGSHLWSYADGCVEPLCFCGRAVHLHMLLPPTRRFPGERCSWRLAVASRSWTASCQLVQWVWVFLEPWKPCSRYLCGLALEHSLHYAAEAQWLAGEDLWLQLMACSRISFCESLLGGRCIQEWKDERICHQILSFRCRSRHPLRACQSQSKGNGQETGEPWQRTLSPAVSQPCSIPPKGTVGYLFHPVLTRPQG